jgi:hypothetical protein
MGDFTLSIPFILQLLILELLQRILILILTRSVFIVKTHFIISTILVHRNLGHEGRAGVFVSTRQAKGNAVSSINYRGLYNHSLVRLDGEHEEKNLYIPILNSEKPQEKQRISICFSMKYLEVK